MKSLLYPEFGRVEVADQPMARVASDEVLLKVAACGICGSELEAFKTKSPRRPPPLILGHEFCGVIAEVGPRVENWNVGQRVVSNALVACGNCPRCNRGDTHLCAKRQVFGMHRPGALAEYVNVPARALIDWPSSLSAEAACLAEPLGNGVHVSHLVEHLSPRTALVIGAGPIGLMCQQAMQTMLGTEVTVTDLNEDRLRVASQRGAKQVISGRAQDPVAAMMDLTGGEGVDVVVDAVGAAVTKQQSIAAVRPGGAAVWIGLHENPLTFNSYEITLPEKQIIGSYGATQPELKEAVELMSSNRVDVQSWPERFELSRADEAFNRMLAAKGKDIKAVVAP